MNDQENQETRKPGNLKDRIRKPGIPGIPGPLSYLNRTIESDFFFKLKFQMLMNIENIENIEKFSKVRNVEIFSEVRK